MIEPTTSQELASALADANASRESVVLQGCGTKRLMGGPIENASVRISTIKLRRVLQYEPRDLTISVEAGMKYSDLTQLLAANRQMIPLDPAFMDDCTIGGVVAANVSGPRRRLYGTARDMVIGMKFATLEGKLVDTGGMVVKNVAGLDMGKLMIGSFGTLAAIAVINFKLMPIPEATRTFIREFSSVHESVQARDAVLRSVLQPSAIDVHKIAQNRYRLLIQAGGNRALLDRYSREFTDAQMFEGAVEEQLWEEIREMTPSFLKAHPNGAVVRISCLLSQIGGVLESLPAPAIARAGSGVCYGYFNNWKDAAGRGVLEYAPDEARAQTVLWPEPGSDFEMMKKIKDMFDPHHVLNRRRLYGRI